MFQQQHQQETSRPRRSQRPHHLYSDSWSVSPSLPSAVLILFYISVHIIIIIIHHPHHPYHPHPPPHLRTSIIRRQNPIRGLALAPAPEADLGPLAHEAATQWSNTPPSWPSFDRSEYSVLFLFCGLLSEKSGCFEGLPLKLHLWAMKWLQIEKLNTREQWAAMSETDRR